MLVYGDPRFLSSVGRFSSRVQAALQQADLTGIDNLRVLLIQAGQLEQGISDLSPELAALLLSPACTLTDAFASAFVRRYTGKSNSVASSKSTLLEQTQLAFLQLTRCQDHSVTIKVPEGFEFYGLFPERSCVAAQAWAQTRSGSTRKTALVVGIRSIGTTLSAVLKATLEQLGWRVQRLTVRPVGHPYSRQVQIPAALAPHDHPSLIVDEGPGISGSSMAAVARALRDAGYTDISFFPGHPNEPGTAASPDVRQCWHETPRYVVNPQELRWDGKSLQDLLLEQTKKIQVPNPASPYASPRFTDLSSGKWREVAYSLHSDWPPANIPFERTKWLFRTSHDSAILWKFSGLGSATDSQPVSAIHHNVVYPETFGVHFGFSATSWISGNRLTSQAARNPQVLSQLLRYVSASRVPRPVPREALHRLQECLLVNTRESLGEAAADLANGFANRMAHAEASHCYTDGRMAPCEWVQTADGSLYKTDHAGHMADHTLVGRQSWLWDLAGLLIEWDLPLTELQSAHPQLVREYSEPILHFYCMAYSAFRLGMCSMCASQLASQPEEQKRLQNAATKYQSKLSALIQNAHSLGELSHSSHQ